MLSIIKKSILPLSLIPFIFFSQTKRAITVDDLWAMKRIGTYDISPDGKTLAYTLTSYSFEANKGNSDIYLIDADGKNLRALKNSEKNETEPKFSPDGKTIAFVRGGQIWQCNLDGSNEKQLNKYLHRSIWVSNGLRMERKFCLFHLFTPNAQLKNAMSKRIKLKQKVK